MRRILSVRICMFTLMPTLRAFASFSHDRESGAVTVIQTGLPEGRYSERFAPAIPLPTFCLSCKRTVRQQTSAPCHEAQ